MKFVAVEGEGQVQLRKVSDTATIHGNAKVFSSLKEVADAYPQMEITSDGETVDVASAGSPDDLYSEVYGKIVHSREVAAKGISYPKMTKAILEACDNTLSVTEAVHRTRVTLGLVKKPTTSKKPK